MSFQCDRTKRMPATTAMEMKERKAVENWGVGAEREEEKMQRSRQNRLIS